MLIRAYETSDRDDIYDVCVRTAACGGDARGLYDSDQLMGDLFAGPYAYLEPHLSFVVDDGTRVVGYVVGTSDTANFVERYKEIWIPKVADRYELAPDPPATPTETMLSLHFRPDRMIVPELAKYPAHLHIDLLPDAQRRGLGRKLIKIMLDALRADGADAVHIGMLTDNTNARSFYDRLGFHVIDVPDSAPLTYLGRSTII